MSDKFPTERAPQAADEATHEDASLSAPRSKLALAAMFISVLALVTRCGLEHQRHREQPASKLGQSSASAAALDSLHALQAMSVALQAKARSAQPGALTAEDCDHSAYARFLAARDSLATQLDASAPALGRTQYLALNDQLVALAMSTAEASEALTSACVAAQRAPS